MTSLNSFFPSATNMIRLDHTHVLSTFHQYKADGPDHVRKALANTICTALEVHATLEEEIFYPAVRAAAGDGEISDSYEEHQEMKELIMRLRATDPRDPEFNATVMALMKDVLHHVADEETVVLPAAELKMRERLGELGMRMTKRRIELVAPRTGEIAVDMACAASGNKVLLGAIAAATFGAAYLLARSFSGARRQDFSTYRI